MEITYHGANCIRISTKNAAVLVDNNVEELGLKSKAKKDDIVINTFEGASDVKEPKIVIDTPGEFEVSGISIQGIAARAHMDEEGEKNAVIYKLMAGDIRVVVLGHVYPEFSETQLEALGFVDILIIPVGGNGYTLDGTGAAKVVKELDPDVVLPTHFADKAVSYEVSQQTIEEALQALPFEEVQPIDKYKIKSKDLLEKAGLVILQRQQ